MSSRADSKQQYMSADEVAKLVTGPKQDNPEYLIIDVRSSDFEGGNLPGAVNITTGEFRDEGKLSRVIDRYIRPNPNLRTLIVHCMRSQTRGPYAAHLLAQHPDLPKDIKVVILEGGFQGWYHKFKGRKEMFEGLLEDEAGVVGRGEGRGEWQQRVQAQEGESGEAEDSRQLRQEQGR
ncbi:hypothetical protein JCM8097_001364 [Rhodosporidiobolus ruineniae]